MHTFLQKAAMLSLCMALAVPAFAQGDKEAKPVAKLEVNKGTVMTSRGGEYITGATGEDLYKEERLMVTEDASATVVFNDKCKRTYDKPGVYEIDADCKAVAFWGVGTAALIVAGVAATEEVISYEERKKRNRVAPAVNPTGNPPPISQ